MLTPQEVSEHGFPKANFGGYNMTQVDEFLDLLTVDYTALYSENAVLKSKMKVLVDKVEEYRSTEEAMRRALMTAQRMADDMVQEAQKRCTEMIEAAKAEAESHVLVIRQERENEQFRLSSAQEATASFVASVRDLHAKQLLHLDTLGELCPPTIAPTVEAVVTETVSEIDDSVQRLLSQAMEDASRLAQQERDMFDMSQNADTDAQDEDAIEDVDDPFIDTSVNSVNSSRSIDFGSLQFGRDFELK